MMQQMKISDLITEDSPWLVTYPFFRSTYYSFHDFSNCKVESFTNLTYVYTYDSTPLIEMASRQTQ